MTQEKKQYKFKIVCNRCGHDDVDIRGIAFPHWDDGYIMDCEKCGQTGDVDDELLETDWIKT